MRWPGFLTIKEASDKTGYNPEYLRRLIRQEKIKAQKVGTVYFVDAESLDSYVESVIDPEDARTGPRN